MIQIGELIAFIGLFNMMRWPVFASIFAFTLVQLGIASAKRMLNIIQTETDIDENPARSQRRRKGDIRFEQVGFGYEDGTCSKTSTSTSSPGRRSPSSAGRDPASRR